VVGAYAGWRFLTARSREERAHYDWMGYTANFVAILGLLPLPFAGYWLMAEIYAYSQQMGIMAMGGILAWLWILQGVLIGVILFAGNFYLWSGLSRTPGGVRYRRWIPWIATVLTVGLLVWVTPHTLILSATEAVRLGGSHHHTLGPLGLMPAKNIAVNLMLIATFLSFQLYRRADRVATSRFAPLGNAALVAIYTVAVANILFTGVYYGYFTDTVYKVGSSVPQVASTVVVIISGLLIDSWIYRDARRLPSQWGEISDRSQYALFALPIAFSWLMALMGYLRSALRSHWHVYGIMDDRRGGQHGIAGDPALSRLDALYLLDRHPLQQPPDSASRSGERDVKRRHPALPVLLFCLGLIALFNLVALLLPQVEGERPQLESLDLAGVAGSELLAVGERLYHGKGACSLCHNDMGRAPPLLTVDLRRVASERIGQPGYSGAASDPRAYLLESLLQPDAWVVPGFGQKGSDDRQSPMPAADRPPASLSEQEIGAIVAFLLQSESAVAATPAPAASDELAASDESAGRLDPAAAPPSPLTAHGCTACHPLSGDNGPVGPSLAGVAERLGRDGLRRAILDPAAEIAAGYSAGVMPANYGTLLTAGELERIIELLSGGQG
jgi:cytochrome c551/c552